MLRIVAWSFGCRLKFIYSVVLVEEKFIYYLYIHLTIFISCVPWMLEFTKETLPKFIRIFNV